MKFGLWYGAVGPYTSPDAAKALAQGAESAGFDSLWTGEHIVVPADYVSEYPYSDSGRMAGDGAVPMAEPLTWFAYLAGITTSIRMVSGVLILPQRNPLILAKQAVTLDVLSGGRFSLGVGIGWLREEFAALGASFDDRVDRFDEYVRIMRELWSEPEATFDGKFYSFQRARMSPRPPQGAIPIVVGGHSRAAAERAGRLGDGFFPAKGSPDELAELFALARKSAESAGRDPDALEITISEPTLSGDETLKTIETWAGLGVDRIIVPVPTFDPNAIDDVLGKIRQEVIDNVA